MTGIKRKTKLATLASAVEMIKDGDTLALGGFMMHNNPMALSREIIRQGKKDLSLIISPSAGMAADLLIGAGCVTGIRSTYVGFDHLGLAPSFRRAVQEEKLNVLEYDEVTVLAGLKAGAGKLPYVPVTSVIGSDILKVNPELKLVDDCDFTVKKKAVLIVPPLIPDVAVLHVQIADHRGNAIHTGSRFTDVLMARASKKTIISTDNLVDESEWKYPPAFTTLHNFYVDKVVHQPGGAYPCSSHGNYLHDEQHLREYLLQAKRQDTLNAYIDEYIRSFDENKTKELVSKLPVSGEPSQPVTTATSDTKDYSIAEFIAIILSRELKNGETGGVGASSAIPIAAVRLAQHIHAPDLNFVLSGGGVINTKSNVIYPSSTDCRYYLKGAEGIMELGNDFFDLVEQGPDFFFFSGIQIDRHGNFNLHCVGDWNKPRFRGPGLPSVGAVANSKRFFLYSTNQTRRQFIERCDFISGPGFLDGYDSRQQLGLEGGGPAICVTNLAVYDFHENSKRMRLKSIHPGIDLETIKENTGFDLIYPEEISITLPPSDEELRTLRTRVDTTRLLMKI